MFTILEKKHNEEQREFIVTSDNNDSVLTYGNLGYISLHSCKKSETKTFLDEYFESNNLIEEEQTILHI